MNHEYAQYEQLDDLRADRRDQFGDNLVDTRYLRERFQKEATPEKWIYNSYKTPEGSIAFLLINQQLLRTLAYAGFALYLENRDVDQEDLARSSLAFNRRRGL